MENKQDNKLFSLDVLTICMEQGFRLSMYPKPTLTDADYADILVLLTKIPC